MVSASHDPIPTGPIGGDPTYGEKHEVIRPRDILLGDHIHCYYCGTMSDIPFRVSLIRDNSDIKFIYYVCDDCAYILLETKENAHRH